MGFISKVLTLTVAAVGGIYLSSKDGADTRKKIQHHISNLTPVIKDLLHKAEDLLVKSKDLNSDEIRTNVEKKVSEIKKSLQNIDAKKVGEKAEEVVKKASKGIRKLKAEVSASKVVSGTKKRSVEKKDLQSKTIPQLKIIAKTQEVKLSSSDKKDDIIKKISKNSTKK